MLPWRTPYPTGSDISQQAIGGGGQGQAPMTGLNLNGIEVEAASRLLDQMVNGQGPFGQGFQDLEDEDDDDDDGDDGGDRNGAVSFQRAVLEGARSSGLGARARVVWGQLIRHYCHYFALQPGKRLLRLSQLPKALQADREAIESFR